MSLKSAQTNSAVTSVAISAYGTARSLVEGAPLNPDELPPISDGAVLPVLDLNGYKIHNPTVLARVSHEEAEALFVGYGYTPYFVEGSEYESMHEAMAATLEHCVLEIRRIQDEARRSDNPSRSRWPIILLRSPKGWTTPRKVDRHYLAGAPDPDYRYRHKPRPPQTSRDLDARLQAGGAIQRERATDSGVEGSRPQRASANERKPGRELWSTPQGAPATEFSRFGSTGSIYPRC